MGLHQAWPDAEITGVDVKWQPNYCGHHFIQGDALAVARRVGRRFDFMWASPPCQKFTAMRTMWNAKEHPDLISPIRDILLRSGVPFCIENVTNAPLQRPTVLCGTMFNMTTRQGTAELRRHRLFETTFPVIPLRCNHNAPIVIGVYGSHGRDRRRTITVVSKQGGYTRQNGERSGNFTIAERCEAMGIDWMRDYELSQAVPPAYSRYIAEQYSQSLVVAAVGNTIPS
jgi:DNA (cytosine-5)-methyltransferase 1